MKPYFDLKKTKAPEVTQCAFRECSCIPRSLRKTAIDEKLLNLIKESKKTEITILSVGCGELGQEYYINKLLRENGIRVQWLLVDPECYTIKHWDLLETFKQSMEESGSSVLGAYSDISGYAAFKLGKSGFTALKNSGDGRLFTKTWIELAHDHCINLKICHRKAENSLPAVDLVLAIDLTPTKISSYRENKALTDLMLEAVRCLDPEAVAFSVIRNKKDIHYEAANSENDLEIEVHTPSKKRANCTARSF